jgi:hypothetical protein
MSTNRDFNSMLNEYLTIDLMKDELVKRDYLLQKVDRDDGWKSGTIPVPFEGQHASTITFGSLAADTNISKYKYVRGQLTTFREAWGTMRFEHRDLMEHDGKINEKSFLKILPGQIDDFLNNMKMAMSVNMLNGPHFVKLTVDGTAGGVIEVDRIDRLTIDQQINLLDGNTAEAAYYVISIDVNGGTLKKGSAVVSATRGGAAADVSAYTVAQNAKGYHPGASTESFTSLESQLLSAANGGSSALFGQTKTAYPYLQAVQYDGSAISATNILGHLFAAYSRRQTLAKSGALSEYLMSYKHFGSCLALLEQGGGTSAAIGQKGVYNIVPGSRKISVYGWQEVSIGSVTGELLKLVAIQEKSDETILCLDWSTIRLYTNGFLQRRTAPDGKQFFEVRATSGYAYILDNVLMGDLTVFAPSKNLIIHSIPNY